MNAIGVAFAANLILGLFLLAFGALALRIPHTGPARWLLAAYFALVGLNYASDGAAVLLNVKNTGTPFDFISAWTNILDPPTLLLFCLAITGIRLTWLRAGLAYAASLVLLVHGPVYVALGTPPAAVFTWFNWNLAITFVSYVGAFAILARRYFLEGEAQDRDASGVLVTAFGVICLTRVPLAFVDFAFIPSGIGGRGSPRSLVMEASLLATFLAFALVARARTRGPAWSHARGVLVRTGGLLLVVEMEWLLRFVPYVQNSSYALLYSVRWLLFLAFVTSGLRRHGLIGIPTSVAAWMRRTYTALLLVAATPLAASLVRSLPGVSDVGALAVGAATVGAVGAAAYALRLAMPRLPPEAEWRRAAVYRAHLALGSSWRDLERVRRELGISDREARDIEGTVLIERQIPDSALPDRVEPGRLLLGRYRVERLIGVGAFGRVHAAIDTVAGDRVVLKELLPEWRHDPEALARFRREAETALRIRHPNLVEFRGIERLASGHVLVLACVEGETLAGRLARGPLGEAEGERLARDLLAGLAQLHRNGILHRDVKPENVVLRPDGGAVLLDFGAVTGQDGRTRLARGAHPGTRGYASPEQERGEPLTTASDVYAAGVLLWRALAGTLPPEGRVPSAWRAPLEKALAPRAQARPVDAAAFLKALPVAASTPV